MNNEILNPGLCHNDAPWRVWDTTEHDFGSCFANVALPTAPLAFLFTAGLFYAFSYLKLGTNEYGKPYTSLDTWRLSMTLLLSILPCLGTMIEITWGLGVVGVGFLDSEELYADICLSIAAFGAAALMHAEVLKGVAESRYVGIYLVLIMFSLIPRSYSSIAYMFSSGSGHVFWDRANYALLACSVVLLVVSASYILIKGQRPALHIIPLSELGLTRGLIDTSEAGERGDADQDEEDRLTATTDGDVQPVQPPLELNASFFSILTFSWVSPLISLGHERPLKADDIHALHKDERSIHVSAAFDKLWADELSKPLGSRSLTRVFVRLLRPILTVSAVFKFFYDTLMFVGPIILFYLLRFLKNVQAEEQESAWIGYGLCVVLVVSNLVQTSILHQYFHRQFRAGIRVKSAVINAVYNKSLRLREGEVNVDTSGQGAGEAPKTTKDTGQVVNLMAVDSQRLQDVMTYVQIIWSAPYQIAIALFLLWRQVGASVVAGLAVMLFAIPLSSKFSTETRRRQKMIMECRDERARITNEVISSIKVIKMYSWEDKFVERIDDIRTKELKFLWHYQIIQLCSRMLWLGTPALVSLMTFSVYTTIGGNTLDAATAFTALSLFNILQFPLTLLPATYNNINEALISVQRVQANRMLTRAIISLRPPKFPSAIHVSPHPTKLSTLQL